MKKISASYWIFAAPCFLWGCVDLYHYVVIGPGVIENHEGIHSVQQLVNNSLWMGLIKILLTVAILAAGWFMGKRREKSSSPALLSYFTRRVGLVLFGLWLLTMSLLTVGTAQYVLEEIVEAGYDFPEYAGMAGGLDEYYPTEETASLGETLDHRPGGADYHMLEAITRGGSLHNSAPSLAYYPHEPLWEGIYRSTYPDLNTAILFVDSEENILHQNGDFFYFNYATAATWAQQSEATDGYAWVDLSDEEDERYGFMRVKYAGVRSLYDWDTVRMIGYFDGSRFEPLSMALADDWSYAEAIEQHSPPVSEDTDHASGSNSADDNTSSDSGSGPDYTLSQLDAMGLIEWEERYDHAADAPADKALVTIYCMRPEMMLYDSSPVRYQGQVYDDLVTLLAQEGYYRSGEGSNRFHQRMSQISLWNSVVFGVRSYWDFSDYDFTSNQPWPAPVITMITAVQASPLLIAAGYLRNVYLITAALVLVIFFWLRNLLKNHVSIPLKTVNNGIANGWHHLPEYIDTPPELAEPRELVEHYRSTQQRLYGYKNEATRLNTALTYAKTAEENRRQMTSHIAHELKTPLAVIHSYTEALQERIAEEKRDQYLSVILAETERMDSMVLEMLDLSRLEAGRVKLAQDEFSLLEMTKDIFARLEMALQAKNLQVTYQCYFDAMVTADEGRIRQVVENFATNAVKHTPPDGEIRVHIYADRQGTVFSMENDGEQLPAEVLGKVWDSFWRQDESRTSPGTGLGLAIAKGIITLHGGECSAHNTKRGVEFRFRI